MNKATKIEVGDTVRIIESRQFSHDHLEGETRVVRDTIRRYRSRPARVSVLLDETPDAIALGGLIIDLDVEQVEKVDPCVYCGALVSEEEVVTAETRESDGQRYVDEVGCSNCYPEPMDADTIGDIRFHEARDEPEMFGGRLV